MAKRRKSKELKENEDDLLFYLEYWKKYPRYLQADSAKRNRRFGKENQEQLKRLPP